MKTGDSLTTGLLAGEVEGRGGWCSRRGGGASLVGEIEIGGCWSHDCFLYVLKIGVCVQMAQMLGGRRVKASTPVVGISNKEKEVEADLGS